MSAELPEFSVISSPTKFHSTSLSLSPMLKGQPHYRTCCYDTRNKKQELNVLTLCNYLFNLLLSDIKWYRSKLNICILWCSMCGLFLIWCFFSSLLPASLRKKTEDWGEREKKRKTPKTNSVTFSTTFDDVTMLFSLQICSGTSFFLFLSILFI